jgi:hypothetical protein
MAMNNGLSEAGRSSRGLFKELKQHISENNISAEEVGLGNEIGSRDVPNYETVELTIVTNVRDAPGNLCN